MTAALAQLWRALVPAPTTDAERAAHVRALAAAVAAGMPRDVAAAVLDGMQR